jgi:hypothetical protein
MRRSEKEGQTTASCGEREAENRADSAAAWGGQELASKHVADRKQLRSTVVGLQRVYMAWLGPSVRCKTRTSVDQWRVESRAITVVLGSGHKLSTA